MIGVYEERLAGGGLERRVCSRALTVMASEDSGGMGGMMIDLVACWNRGFKD